LSVVATGVQMQYITGIGIRERLGSEHVLEWLTGQHVQIRDLAGLRRDV
jgi:hypothetical protein